MLELVDVSKTYANGVCALDSVSLKVPKGMFGLLGPNGAGKSSLMRTVATLQRPDSGAIRFGGLDVLDDPVALRRRLGYLPQEFGAYPRTSPRVMLDHIAALKGFAERRQRTDLVDRLLAQTNLWDVRDKNIDTFSGGMKQRFGIAQALIGEPDLIIVDEPTAGLDPAERRRFHNLLAEIGEDVVVILSTHIVDDVADLCPLMAIMGGGRILLQGQPVTLIDELAGRLWAKVADRREARALNGTLPVVSTRLVPGAVEVRVLAGECPGPGFELVAPNLEDVYFATLLSNGLNLELA